MDNDEINQAVVDLNLLQRPLWKHGSVKNAELEISGTPTVAFFVFLTIRIILSYKYTKRSVADLRNIILAARFYILIICIPFILARHAHVVGFNGVSHKLIGIGSLTPLARIDGSSVAAQVVMRDQQADVTPIPAPKKIPGADRIGVRLPDGGGDAGLGVRMLRLPSAPQDCVFGGTLGLKFRIVPLPLFSV
jgi:hypothetical protein